MADWFKLQARKGTIPEVTIFGEITSGSAAKFSEAWRSLGKPARVDLRISSPGGDCFAGAAVHDIVANSGAAVTVYVDGLAASMASFIAMAGRKIVMGGSAQMMIHMPAANGIGGAGDLQRTARLLETIGENMVRVYSKRSGRPEDAVRRMMDEETWMDAETAVKLGFADEIAGNLRMAASAFDLSRFTRAPAPTSPNTMSELSEQFWAGKGKSPAPAAVGDEDISDLIPTPRSHAETWARFNAQGRGRMGGVK